MVTGMRRKFDAAYLSSFCMELYLVLGAGIPLSEGVGMLAEGEHDRRAASVLSGIGGKMDGGGALHTALRESGAFPSYMTDMLEIGALTGRTDTVLKSLSDYYERQDRLSASIRSAVVYPSVLLAMLLFVLVILITRVLPIFSDVFGQLGSSLSGAALVILRAGIWLRMHWLPVVLFPAALLALILLLRKTRRGRLWLNALSPGRRLRGAVASARFASALALTMQSGLDAEESLEMALRLVTDAEVRKRLENCRDMISSGVSFIQCISQASVFSITHCRMLEVGFRTGSADTVMAEIARRCEENVQSDIEGLVARVEPTLVIIMTGLVGLILLSVMLPLMGVMSGLG